jgi:hypothetical protein
MEALSIVLFGGGFLTILLGLGLSFGEGGYTRYHRIVIVAGSVALFVGVIISATTTH